MPFDFNTIWNRRETYSMKWDVSETELPMWVADMDFQTAPEITNAIMNRAQTGIFGYEIVPEAWYEAIEGWWKTRHHFAIRKNWLIFCTGVVPAISSAVRKMTTVGENVLVQTPVYNIFFNSIVNNGRRIIENKLHYDGCEYSMDFEDLEMKLMDPQTTMMILCNPHNPIGMIWDRETLEEVGALCAKHHVLVLSDEIHCDLTDPGSEYIPFASVSEQCAQNSITCMAPTKAFNLAGLQTAAVMIPNEVLRHKMNRALNTDEVAEPNAFAVHATIAAFTRGEAWLDDLREYLAGNKACARAFLEKEIPQITAVPSQATYLLWLDCRKVAGNYTELCKFIQQHTGLILSDGSTYGSTGDGFLRMNIACPREQMTDGLQRLKKGIDAYVQQIGDRR